MVELEGTCTIPVSSLTAEGKRSLRGGTFHGSGRAGPRPRPPVLAPSSSPRLAARLPRPARGADGMAATWRGRGERKTLGVDSGPSLMGLRTTDLRLHVFCDAHFSNQDATAFVRFRGHSI